MNYRALIFDDDSAIREILCTFFENRKYEVFAFPNPGICPLSEEHICPCPEKQSCSDIIISDLMMPCMNGLDFVDEQIKKGCKCNHLALMSGALTEECLTKARSLGLKIFPKPFRLSDVGRWLDQIEKEINPNRKLADWYVDRLKNKKT